MTDLISQEDKDRFDNVFNDLHDTFAREITIFKKAKKTFISTNQTYNALYSRVSNQKEKESTVSAIKVRARITYFNEAYKRENQENFALGFDIPGDYVRIKIDEEGYTALKNVRDVEIDGELFNIVSDASKSGIFSVKYYQYILKRAG